jgi:hypothetical protein
MEGDLMKALYSIMVTLCIPVFALAIQAPDWVRQLDTLSAGLTEIQTALTHDIVMYNSYQIQLQSIITLWDQGESLREQIIQQIIQALHDLQENLQECHDDLYHCATSNDTLISSLQNTITTLQKQTQLEIVILQETIVFLTQELTQAHDSYAHLLNGNRNRAQHVIDELEAIQHRYQYMVNSRTYFLTTLDQFMMYANTFMRDATT